MRRVDSTGKGQATMDGVSTIKLEVIESGVGQLTMRTQITLSPDTAQHLVELRPVLAAAQGKQGLTLAEVVLALVETQTGKGDTTCP